MTKSSSPFRAVWWVGGSCLATSLGCTIAEPDSTHASASTSLGSASASVPEGSFSAPSLEGSASHAAVSTASASASPSACSSADVAPEKPACAPGMILVGRYCIDAFEDALEQRASDGTWVAHPYFDRPPSGTPFRAVSQSGQFPQGYISRVESKAACEASGKRLCSKSEWQRACRGKGGSAYPYGGEHSQKGRCNSGKIHLLTQMFKNPPGGMKYDEHFNSPELNKTPDFLARSGEYEGCTNEAGVHDMVGNLHEWVSDTVTDELMEKLDEEGVERRNQPWHEGNGVFMGGFYSTTGEHGPGCWFITVAHEPSYHDYSTGFRCCEDAALPLPTKKKAAPPSPSTGSAAPTRAAPPKPATNG